MEGKDERRLRGESNERRKGSKRDEEGRRWNKKKGMEIKQEG